MDCPCHPECSPDCQPQCWSDGDEVGCGYYFVPDSRPPLPGRIESLGLHALTEQEQVDVKSRLHTYELLFSAHDGVLGCTNLLAHDIPLLDDVPVRQRYQHIPPLSMRP